MRIALICPYAIDVPGGVQSQVTGMADGLVGLGHDVAVVAPGVSQVESAFLFYGVGSPIAVPVNGSRAPVSISPLSAVRTNAALGSFRPEIVHIHEPFAPGPAITAMVAHKAPTIATFHRAGTSAVYRAVGRLLSPLTTRLDDLVAVSAAAHDTMMSALLVRDRAVSLIENAVDVGRYDHAVAWPGEGTVIVFAGRHEPRKGLGTLLEAFSQSPIDALLWVLGSGPQSNALKARYGSDPRITWCGRVSDDELARRVRRADVFVAPSLSGESYGVILLEAMAGHTAIIASDLPGYRLAGRELVEYVPPGEVVALGEAIMRLVGAPELRQALAERGREHVAEQDFSFLVRRYVEHYKQLLEKGSAR